MERTPRSVRRGVVPVTAALSGLALALTCAPAVAAASIPEVDEIRSSQNVSLLSNIPKSDVLPGFNSDLAFSDDLAFQGNYDGFRIWDIDDPEEPEIVSEVLCPGSQNDVSVTGDLVFLSTDSRRTDDSCSSEQVTTPQDGVLTDYWEGIKIFDVSDPEEPEYVTAIETDCGSHTHTLVPGGDDDTVYIYVSSYDISENLADCMPPHDKITIIEVPLDDPQDAKVVAEPVLFAMAATRVTRSTPRSRSAARRSSSPTSSAAAAPPRACQRSPTRAAPTASTTSSAGVTTASSCTAATTRSRARTPRPRTASPTTAR